MSDYRTGRTRLRLGREYGEPVLVLQVETAIPPVGDKLEPTIIWRDARAEDVSIDAVSVRVSP